jgi:hypothetical protein
VASIELTARATDALRKRGSHLYIWADQAGMIHVRTKPPSKSANFETVERDGLAIHIESEIKPPTRWVITHTRLPWPHFNALYDPVEHGDRVGTVVDNILWP